MSSSKKPKLLFVCQNLPFPPDGGALIRSYHTLRLLTQWFDVTALHFYQLVTKSGPEAVTQATAHLAQMCDIEAFRIPQDGSRVRYIWDHVRSVATRRAYTRWMFDSTEAYAALESAFAHHSFDLVHLDSLDLVGFLERLPTPKPPTVVAHHNVESQLLRRRADSESGWRRTYMTHQAQLTEREEATWCPKVDLNLVVSPEDGATLRRIAPGARTVVVPNGVDTQRLQPAPEGEKAGVVFVGGYSWFPNADGMHFFADEILPRIHLERPDVSVTWVGRAPDAIRAEFKAKGIEMTGYVESINQPVDPAACFVVPLRVGGGTRLKILDAWSLGKAVVSTSPGCEGLAVADGENMLVADDPAAFAEATLRVLDEPELRGRLEIGGRATVERYYDWEVIGEIMHDEYLGLL